MTIYSTIGAYEFMLDLDDMDAVINEEVPSHKEEYF